MKQTNQESFVVSVEEMRVLRQGLFVTLHHGDAVIRHDLQTITGYELGEFRQLMWDIDELSGHNDETRLLLEGQVRELAALTATELDGHSQRVREVRLGRPCRFTLGSRRRLQPLTALLNSRHIRTQQVRSTMGWALKV